nr:copia protein [Tanacetum cinerariifolium]
LEEQSLDDLFNSLNIYETEVKSSSSTGTTTQNLAFVSSSNTTSTIESVSAAASVYVVCAKMHVSYLPNIDVDDLEEMDLIWQMAMLTMRARRFLQKTGRNLGANGPTSMGFDMSKVECYNCHRNGHFARECWSPWDSRRNCAAEQQRRTVPVETFTSNALVSQCDGVGSYDWSFQAKEKPANFTLMAFSSLSSSSDNKVVSCLKACLESVEARLLVYKQKESVFEEDIKLLNLEVQLRNNALVTLRQKLKKAEQERDDLKLKLENFQTSSKNLTELSASQTNEKTGLGYNSQVFTRAMFDCDDYLSSESDKRTFMTPKPDLVFNNAPTTVETHHSAFNVQLSSTKPAQDLSHTNRPTSPIIEDWHVETSIPVATPKLAIPKPTSSGKRRIRKACFVCKSLEHLIKDCDYHAKKMVQPTVRNHAHRSDYKQYAPLTHQTLQKHMVPAAVVTQSKPVSITAVRPVSAAMPKFKVTRPRQATPIVTKTNSPIKRHITRSISPKSSNSSLRVTSVKALVVNATQGNMSYLSDFEELNGEYVAFGGNPKGGNLVRGLPIKVFENDNTCVACKKGKQHKASCKTKPVSSVDQPLYRLHIDLFGPTFVRSLNKKSYCLVVTDDYSRFTWVFFLATKDELLQFKMQKVWILVDLPHGKRAIGTKWVFRYKKDERGIVVRNKARLVAQGHTQEERIDYKEVFAPVARIEAIRLFLACASFMSFMVYQMDVKSAFLYGTIKEEVYVCQPPGFEDPNHPNKVYKVVKSLYGLHQSLRAWYETLVNYLLENDFQKGKIDQTPFIKRQKEGKSASTPIDTEKPLLKDLDGEDVDVHTYRSMIGSLMYLTSSRLDIMFTLNDVTMLQALVDKKKVMITKATIREALQLDDEEGVECLPNEEIFAELAKIGYEKPSTKLTFYKAFLSSQWKFLIHIILQCMSAKRTSWNEFSSSMASAVICLSSGRKFNFSKYIFDSLVRNLDSPAKFYMYPRFLQLMIRKQVGALSTHTIKYTSPALTQKVFANMKRVGKWFSRVETPLFEGMLVEQQVVKEGDADENAENVNVGDADEGDMVETSDETKMDDVSNQERMIAEMDQDADVVLEDVKEDDKKVADAVKDVQDSAQDQGKTAESQAKIYKIDMDHANKVLSMQEDETEPAEVQEVVDVVTTAKLITKVVTAASETITAASAIITTAPETQVPTATTAVTLTATPLRVNAAPSRRRKGDEAIDHVKRKAQEDPAIKRYQVLKRKPRTKAQARKNMMSKEQMDEEDSRALKRLNETPAEKAAKKQNLDEEVEELKRHLQIVPNEDDDIYTEATPLARKVPVIDYQIIELNNKPYYKIIRADDTHQLYTCSDLEESEKCLWSGNGQRMEVIGIMWCADHNIYIHLADFVSIEELPTHKIHSRPDAECFKVKTAVVKCCCWNKIEEMTNDLIDRLIKGSGYGFNYCDELKLKLKLFKDAAAVAHAK